MNAEIFAEWLTRQGEPVHRTANSYWAQAYPGVYQAFPYHWLVEPEETELQRLLVDHHALALRYSAPFQQGPGMVSYHVQVARETYGLGELSRKARHDVRRGMKTFRIQPVTFESLAEEGWTARAQTLARQGRPGAESRAWWQRLCRSAIDLPGFEAWAATADGCQAASMILFSCGSTTSILYQQSLTGYLRSCANNTLAYMVTAEVLNRPGVREMFYGLQSLDAPASVDEFKFRMGYTAQPVRQRVVVHPWIKPIFNPASYALVHWLLRGRPGNSFLAKTEGMLRFYLEGRRPAQQQHWPAALRDSSSKHAQQNSEVFKENLSNYWKLLS